MSKIDFGFSKENTPSPEVQEFYRMQGEARAEERIIKLLEGFDPRTAIGDLLLLLIKGENK
jgi:hypothetical protein